ncbi:MAG: hypothetical protein ACREF4_03045 [Gammaproteobacteria bacterium]
MKKKRFTPAWPGSNGNNARHRARQQIKEIDVKIAALEADNERIREDAARQIREIEAERDTERDAKIASIHAIADQARAGINDGIVDPDDIVVGDWYLAIYCSHCRYTIPLYPDPTKGELKFSGPGTFRAPCPECGQEDEYRTEQVVSLEAVEAGSLPLQRDPE